MNDTRRDFLKVLGIGSAAGLTGCSTSAPDRLVPYVVPPEEIVRGHPVWYRTTCRECPAGCGIEARVREGRVHKVEGNPSHPVNGGGLCARGQAAVQGLYNPDRLRAPLVREKGRLRPAAWDEAMGRVKAGLAGLNPNAIGVLTGAATGAIEELARGVGSHLEYEPIAYTALKMANELSFGVEGLPLLRFADARAIYIFGTDVLETFVSPAGYARGIAEARRAGARLVYVGSRLSLTGARADEWVAVKPGREILVALALRGRIGAAEAGMDTVVLERLRAELRARPALAVTGGTAVEDENGVALAAAVNALNAATGALNRTVTFDRTSALDQVAGGADVLAWARRLKALFVAGPNPVYDLRGFRKPPLLVVLSPYQDETAEAADIVLPVHTPLESWGDYEPWTGIYCLQQPAMRPVFDTRDLGDVLLAIGGSGSFLNYLKARWRNLHRQFGAKEDFETFWAASLKAGGCWLEVPAREVKWKGTEVAHKLAAPAPYTLQTYPSLAHFDGRGANRPWLQELPDPITQVVWDSWVEINPRDAARLAVATGDRVRVRSKHGALELPAYVYPGIQPGAAAIPLGQGHTAFGRYATGAGVNAAALLDTNWSGEPVEIALVKKGRELAIVQGHDLEEGRAIARPAGQAEHSLSMYPAHEHRGHRWAMTIDLDTCTGCSACVTACYAENNVPVAGKAEVKRGRHMAWIRLERFFGPGHAVSEPFRIDFTMMLCQQCDHAPCEPVCPVFAAFHNQEGLNGQVYNRCVGTRYCANNCPYKARKFNWFPAEWPAPLDWQLNPDVTVRSKGVMEKCTFCIQRIVQGKDRARREGRALADGDIVPACAQSCPTSAITFGDLNDTTSRVRKAWEDPRRYRVLEDLNTRPAVVYLARDRRQV